MVIPVSNFWKKLPSFSSVTVCFASSFTMVSFLCVLYSPVQTVIARIFYVINKSGNERLTLGELRKSNFMDVLSLLDEEDDINKVLVSGLFL